tara:strand:+ start:254 stop:2344 length:2091 start_codon:yes stop_codon:yes gene_type:complete
MTNQILIDAAHQEEVRVAVTKNNRLEEYDFEFDSRRPIRGNIYLAKVTRVEPSLQAAFVDYGGNKNGFLPFAEVHPDYYQIPVADKEAILKKNASELNNDETDEEINENFNDPSHVEDLGGDDLEEIEIINKKRNKDLVKNYKIQEVIKKNQILLIQISKEERGNKGAAITTYTSIPGRYCVFMPNSTSGGGVSRRIKNPKERKKLKNTLDKLNVPEKMGLIIRTAGAKTTSTEIKRDYKYLTKTWDKIKENTLSSNAPSLIYEDGGVIQRSLRDLYSKDIDIVFIEGKETYKTAKNFMKLLMPSHAVKVKEWKEDSPIFQKNNIEQQLLSIYADEVFLSSGGSLVLNQTEALVAIDVNSGSSTKYHNIEETALKTNLEAAEEIARQLRLRDMAGLVVIDFIDMEKFANRRSVEKKLKESLKSDRSKIQVGKISSFGLLEMSRQRIRSSIKEGVYSSCSNCDGTGLIRSIDSRSLELLRTISEISIKENIKKIDAEIPNEILNYLVNQKRNLLTDLENNKDASINFYGNALLRGNENKIRAFDLNNNEINLDKIIKNNDTIENKNDSKQNKKRKKGKNNKSNKLDNDNKNKINNKNKESDNSKSKSIKKSDQNSVTEKKSTRKKSSKSKQNNADVKKLRKDDNKIEKIIENNKIPSIEDLKKHQDNEIPNNVNHIGAPIKGDEKNEKPKSGWWNKG